VPPDASLFFGAVFGDPAPISFGEGAPESSGFKILTVSRCSGLLPPGVVQVTAVDRIEAKIVDKAKHCCLGVRRIADAGRANRPGVPLGTPFSRRLLAKMSLNALAKGRPIYFATHRLSSQACPGAWLWRHA
jgi:hypothetical protein